MLKDIDKKKVIIDCDPGIDDSFALLIALKHLDVEAITVVGGNVGLKNTSQNACYVLSLTDNKHIPVYNGCDRPILTEPTRAKNIHGSSGLGDMDIVCDDKLPEDMHAVDFIIETFSRKNDYTLITLGPLTNIAMALIKCPTIKENINEILCMGGSLTAGNITSTAEFNFYVDPEAAKIVFESGIKIKMVGLNLCRQNRLLENDAKSLLDMDNNVAQFAGKLLDFSVKSCGGSAMICDACAMSWIAFDNVITNATNLYVCIETKGEHTRGMSVCDYRDYIGHNPKVDIERTKGNIINYKTPIPNVSVATEFDANRFKQLLFETIQSYK